MGASMALAAETPPRGYPVKENNDAHCVVNIPTNSAFDFNLDQFMNLCLQLQREKKSTELQIRIELENWRIRAKRGEPTSECKHRISELLTKFRNSQESQDILIEREKVRLNAYKNVITDEMTAKIRTRLKFFSSLNREHESLLDLVRQDVQDCKALCNRFGDQQIRYRVATKS